jgi:hypothetical protein
LEIVDYTEEPVPQEADEEGDSNGPAQIPQKRARNPTRKVKDVLARLQSGSGDDEQLPYYAILSGHR